MERNEEVDELREESRSNENVTDLDLELLCIGVYRNESRTLTAKDPSLELIDHYKVNHHNRSKNHMEKKIYFQKLLEKLPVNHPSIAEIFNIIGFLYYNQGKYDEALEQYKEALKCEKKANKFISIVENNIGMVYYRQKKYHEALKHYEESLKVKKQHSPENVESIAETLNNIGIVYRVKEDFAQALKYYKEALEITTELNRIVCRIIKVILDNIGYVYRIQGKYKEAFKYLTGLEQRNYQGNIAYKLYYIDKKYYNQQLNMHDYDLDGHTSEELQKVLGVKKQKLRENDK